MSKLVFVFLVSFVFAMAMAQPARDDIIYVPIEAQKVEPKPPTVQIPNQPSVGKFIDRLGSATHLTISEERQVIRRALGSLRDATGASLKATIDAAHAGLDFFLVVPRFGQNLFNTP